MSLCPLFLWKFAELRLGPLGRRVSGALSSCPLCGYCTARPVLQTAGWCRTTRSYPLPVAGPVVTWLMQAQMMTMKNGKDSGILKLNIMNYVISLIDSNNMWLVAIKRVPSELYRNIALHISHVPVITFSDVRQIEN